MSRLYKVKSKNFVNYESIKQPGPSDFLSTL